MDQKPHHITRIDIEPSDKYPKRHPTHGWQVRVRRDGKRLSKFFADARYDGRDGALEAAIHYRDELLETLPEPDARPRKAWSNTGVVGLSVREKKEAGGKPGKTYVQLNWIDADGKRRGASFSVEKWGLRRALWNGCLRLYRERQDAGRPVEEPHVMFARAQEPFADQINAEIAAEGGDPEVGSGQAPDGSVATVGEAPGAGEKSAATPTGKTPRPTTPEEEIKLEEQALQHLASTLFGS